MIIIFYFYLFYKQANSGKHEIKSRILISSTVAVVIGLVKILFLKYLINKFFSICILLPPYKKINQLENKNRKSFFCAFYLFLSFLFELNVCAHSEFYY